jgi:electron transfer flavoprotein alpha subunit
MMSEDDERAAAREERDLKVPEVDLRNGASGIAIWAQTSGENLHPAALEIIGEATRILPKLDGGKITAIVIGKNSEKHADTLIHHGADQVYVISDDRLFNYSTLPYARAVVDSVKVVKPEIMIFSASNIGRDLAPRCASRLAVGLSADCTELDIGRYVSRKKNQRFERAFLMMRPSFGESKLATIIGPWHYPQCATVRPGVFTKIAPDKSRTGEIINFSVDFQESDWNVETLEVQQEGQRIDIEKADIIVAGGKDLGKEGFKMLNDLVEAIRGNGQVVELGASRAAVNAGLAESYRQIGQTGKTVRPEIYMAVGISGAVQHIMGMKDSKKVIAINKDPYAQIFQQADMGIIDDYKNVLPELIEQIKAGFTFKLEK